MIPVRSTETLLGGRTVILNLEGLDLEIAQRIIDFTSGAAFAISGNLQKISNYIFLVTPTNVDISGDLQDLLGTSFDVFINAFQILKHEQGRTACCRKRLMELVTAMAYQRRYCYIFRFSEFK